MARIVTLDAVRYSDLPIYEIRNGLEEQVRMDDPSFAIRMDLRAWVATEWLIYGDVFLYSFVSTSPAKLDKCLHTMYRTGPLAAGVPILGPERWRFWKKRLREISDNLPTLGLPTLTPERIALTLEKMDEHEDKAKRASKRKSRKRAQNQAKSQAKRRAKRHSRRQERR
jgi:hypothetical protein